MQEHHHRMRWKTLEEGIQQLREVAVLEALFGRDGQHNNDPDKVRCTGQMLWSLANIGPSQYTTFIATIDADANRETVGSVANKLRNYESMINGPMQAHISAVIKEFKEGMREEIRKGWKHSPTICHGLIQTALEEGEAPEHLQYIDDIIVWGSTAAEVFEKGERIIQILLEAGFAIKKSKVKGPA
ncbi:hypothetical protein RLOC_00013784 [Lonchura striata]|uniref:Reverse transcriptase domain-containing protein n=1 Tax=Lonchura striata TaxID=40157 RepID=A0A218UPY9_9PASE|nr:hypothetical protein RLOC_00013784 [Lonchura striata domestica]